MDETLKSQLTHDIAAIRNNLNAIESHIATDGDLDLIATAFENIQDDAEAAMNNVDKHAEGR